MSVARLMQMAAAGVAGAGPEPSGWTDPDLGNASYDSVSFSVAGQETTPTGIFLSSDGLKLYAVGFTGDSVNEYDLSTAWDISTASYTQNFSVSSQATIPQGVFFKPDGTKMYIVDNGGDDIDEYDLSTAWDISTASYVQSFSVANEEPTPTGMFFKPDGTKVYISASSGNIQEYDLSIAWDISSASHNQSFAAVSASVRGVFFSPDGDKFFTCDLDDNITEFSMTVSWDISSATSGTSFSIPSNFGSSPQSVFFKVDGSKMYILGYDTDTIYQYSTA